MSDAIVKWAKTHSVGIIIALFTAGGVYAKVVVDMSTLQDNYAEMKKETDELKKMSQEKQVTLQKLLTNQEWIMRQLGR